MRTKFMPWMRQLNAPFDFRWILNHATDLIVVISDRSGRAWGPCDGSIFLAGPAESWEKWQSKSWVTHNRNQHALVPFCRDLPRHQGEWMLYYERFCQRTTVLVNQLLNIVEELPFCSATGTEGVWIYMFNYENPSWKFKAVKSDIWFWWCVFYCFWSFQQLTNELVFDDSKFEFFLLFFL
jgi:hypothetical protein